MLIGSVPYDTKVLSVQPGSLVGYWPMWELSGASAIELSGKTGEMAVNAGFETAGAGGADVFANWTETATGGTITQTTTGGEFRGGAAAAKLARTTGSPYLEQAVQVRPGATGLYTFWTRGDGTNAGRYYVYDVSNASDIIGLTSTGVAGTDFAQVSASFGAPAGCSQILLGLIASSVNSSIAYFDDVSLTALLCGKYVGPTIGQPGIGDGRTAVFFDGNNDYVNMYSPGFASAFNTTEGTVALWAKVNGASVWTDGVDRYLFRIGVDANNLVYGYKYGAGNNTWLGYTAGGTDKSRAITNQPTTWFHVAITYSATANAVKVYFNGAQVGATLTGLGTWSGSLAATLCTVGSSSTVPANPWSGWLGRMVIYDVALPASEIARLARVN